MCDDCGYTDGHAWTCPRWQAAHPVGEQWAVARLQAERIASLEKRLDEMRRFCLARGQETRDARIAREAAESKAETLRDTLNYTYAERDNALDDAAGLRAELVRSESMIGELLALVPEELQDRALGLLSTPPRKYTPPPRAMRCKVCGDVMEYSTTVAGHDFYVCAEHGVQGRAEGA